ncbi:receptor-binding cancer antigen expressed on SiSo cells [Cloeon dipterum]|uniref:receptor-binding cancer antigen expressed on SiSo cells n=1 Tax=Cloeon dipterum TaxID=197152 RepID=UPI00321FCAAB
MIGALQVLLAKLRGLFLWVLALFRRACCCFRRRRRLSQSESHPLTAIGVVPNDPQENVQGGWDTWGKEEDEVTRQIREYRTSLATARQKQNEPEEPEVQADYFQDMIPRVTKAPRVKLSAQEEQVDASRSSLMFAAQPMPIVGGELGTWVEEEGWEAEDAGNWEEEVRRAQREKRAQELQMKRAEHRGGLGERMS